MTGTSGQIPGAESLRSPGLEIDTSPTTLQMLENRWAEGKFLCVGLDVSWETGESLLNQAARIVQATRDIAAAFKPNDAFYTAVGYKGAAELKDVIAYIKNIAPGVPVIWDAKRGDIGDTSKRYAEARDVLRADAMTIQPYLGGSAVKPMLDDPRQMGFVLAHTSNPGAGEFQHLYLQDGSPLWERVAHNVAHSEEWRYGSAAGIVMGATYGGKIRRARQIVGDDVVMLIPGIGKQGGDLEASVRGAMNSSGGGFLINVSSGISTARDENSRVTRESIRAAALGWDRQIREAHADALANPTPPDFHDRLAESGLSPDLQRRISALHDRVLTDEIQVLDPETQHHQFASLVNHGRKLDFDKIKTGTDFFWQWVSTYTNWINETYRGRLPEALVGVANGANRLATTMSASVYGAQGLETYKVNSKTVALTEAARFALQQTKPNIVLIVEDVGTTGGTTSTVIPELQELGIRRIEIAHTWIRNPRLPKLDEAGVEYGAVIHDPLPTYSEDDCRNLPEGFCNRGVKLIPHGQ